MIDNDNLRSPALRLQGNWLEECGYANGTKYRMPMTAGYLAIPLPAISTAPTRRTKQRNL